MAPVKIVVIGDVNGEFETVFQKLGSLQSKNAFAFAIIAGNLFSDPDSTTNDDVEAVSRLVAGKTQVPLTTYFALGNHAFPDKVIFKLESSSGEICPNLFFLGKRTTVKTSEGIKIVSLGGTLDQKLSGVSKESFSPFHSEDDIKSLRGANNADILVTSSWPDGIRKGSKVDFNPNQRLQYDRNVADLCTALKPRYHFSTSGPTFFEREPFFHIAEEASDTFQITRFISLASFNNPGKQKWIYAFSLDPIAAPPISLPVGTTSSPLTSQFKKRGALPDQNSYRFSSDTTARDSRPRKKQRKAPPPGPSECFFCLSNENIATHLITSIGNDSYVTTAKGPLSTSSTFTSLGFPSHMLIIPLSHSPTISLISEPEARDSTFKEMNLFRTSLNNMLKSKSEKLGSVTWEVSRSAGIHVHWQYLPVPWDLIHRGLVKGAFQVQAETEHYPKFEIRTVSETETSDYFRALIWDPESGKDESLILPLDESFRFDLQFGRRVLAKLLGLESRMNWQDCGQSKEEEDEDVTKFKEVFQEFDFTLDE